jgi:putative transposase
MAVGERLGVSQRRACKTLRQHRSVQRRLPKVKSDEAALTAAIIGLATKYGRYGYRRITALLKQAGWRVNSKRVERIWRQEGLKAPIRQPKRRRLWLEGGSCIRLRPEHKNHVWTYDFVADRTANGKAFRMLTIVDEYTRECLAIVVDRKLNSTHVLETLGELFIRRGPPKHIRSDNGPEFCAEAVKRWLKRLEVKTLFIEPGSPWENGCVESFNGKLRDELLSGEVFTTLREAQVLIAIWRDHYNRQRPHSSLGYRPPAPEALLPPGLLSPSAAIPNPFMT